MTPQTATRIRAALAVVLASAALAGCATQRSPGVTRVKLSERECLARAMYFESNRSSDAGMLAVGTVVMNRVKSGKFGDTVCQVVGAPRQFAPGVLTRSMTDSGAPRARRVADAVLAGRRHSGVQNAKFFHTAGYKFPYNNMRYVLVAGGNAFYDKTKAPPAWHGGPGRWGPPPVPTERIDGGPILVANVELQPDSAQSVPSMQVASYQTPPAARRRGFSGGADARMNEPAPPHGVVAGIPTYEPAPGARPVREVQVAALEPSRRPRADFDAPPSARRAETIRQDNGLREEDRWRDQELAESAGVQPAKTEEDWSRRRETRVAQVESAPLPVIDPQPAPRAERRNVERRTPDRQVADRQVSDRQATDRQPPRDAAYGGEAYDAPRPRAAQPDYAADPAPSREVRVASRTPRTVERARPVAADPAATGWVVGAQPARVERGDQGYSPLSNAAAEAGYDVDSQPRKSARRTAAAQPRRSFEGVELSGGDQVQYGYR
ncbi:cell wall hydrolase [Methylopila sp. M107]|uniref:cell wall hydrolase n=1 Tax=Methylopila sp. M107 TaxID=1101190 RepID=UPI0003A7E375